MLNSANNNKKEITKINMDNFQTYYSAKEGWHDPFPDLDSPQTLILVFGHPDFLAQHQPFIDIEKKYPNSVLIGCSGPAGILGDEVVKEGMVISITRFCDTRLNLVSMGKKEQESSVELGNRVAEKLKEDTLVAILTFADGAAVNGSQYMQGINQITGNNTVVTGGLAANSGGASQSWVMKGSRPRINIASAIGFYGHSITFLSSKGSGWKPFGVKRSITKVDQETLYELDGKPALQLYKEYLGEAAKGLPETGLLYPLAILSEKSEDTVVRSIMSINEENQSISFAGDIPEKVSAQLMYGTIENLIEGAEEAVDNLPEVHTHSEGMLSIVASCIGRLLVLGNDAELEIDAVMRKLLQKNQHTQQIGFYSAGEFATLSEGACALHNETLTLTVIYEK